LIKWCAKKLKKKGGRGVEDFSLISGAKKGAQVRGEQLGGRGGLVLNFRRRGGEGKRAFVGEKAATKKGHRVGKGGVLGVGVPEKVPILLREVAGRTFNGAREYELNGRVGERGGGKGNFRGERHWLISVKVGSTVGGTRCGADSTFPERAGGEGRKKISGERKVPSITRSKMEGEPERERENNLRGVTRSRIVVRGSIMTIDFGVAITGKKGGVVRS